MISGAVTPDAGEIRVEGRAGDHPQPDRGARYGIETIYQDLAMLPNLDVVDEHLPRPRAAPARPAAAGSG